MYIYIYIYIYLVGQKNCLAVFFQFSTLMAFPVFFQFSLIFFSEKTGKKLQMKTGKKLPLRMVPGAKEICAKWALPLRSRIGTVFYRFSTSFLPVFYPGSSFPRIWR